MKNFMRLRKTAKNKAFAKTFSCEVELLKEQLDIVNKKKKNDCKQYSCRNCLPTQCVEEHEK